MTDVEKEEGAGEQDDVSFLRTGDVVCTTSVCSTKEAGLGGTERVALAAEGVGNRVCYLENVSDKNVPPDIGNAMFYIDHALSIRALQEMMSIEGRQEVSSGGRRTLLYGHAVQLKHVLSDMFLACLSTCSSSDKLSFDVGLQETNKGESCWWIVHPASKQRSEGEKVRVGDDVILVSVATERYLHMTNNNGLVMVIASFHQTLWSITPISSGGVRSRYIGNVFGNDVFRFFHGYDECLTIPENWSDHPQHNMVIYESGNACNQARSLWRLELIRTKWHGAFVGWEQVFRIRHITSGRYLGVTADHLVCLLHKDRADFEASAFLFLPAKDAKRQGLEEKEEEGMGKAVLKYGDANVFLQHFHSNLWLSYQTTEVTKKGVGKVEEKKAMAFEEGHMDDCFLLFMAQEEESKSARVIRKCSQVLNRFLKGLEGLQIGGRDSAPWRRVDLGEVTKLMEDLIEYFKQPSDEIAFEEKQICLKALRNRQDLFQEEGVLNMILDTIDQFSLMESSSDISAMVGQENQATWDNISTYLYLLLAAMIKGNHSNCAQFASVQRLDWLFGRLANPQSAEGILDVLYCVLTESPEALNVITESHILLVISLLEKVGREEKILDVLSSLCLGNQVAVRSSQNAICNNLLPGKDLLLQTTMVDHVSSMMPNILIGLIEGSSMFKKWYYEAEVEHLEQMTSRKCHLRIGWANTVGYNAYPGSGQKYGCNGVGDDLFSFGFDGKRMHSGGRSRSVGVRDLQKGDIIGCWLDLTVPEIRFTLNGNLMQGSFKDFNVDGYFFPVMSLSARISCRFILGGNQGKLKYGPPRSFSAIFEAVRGELKITSCFSFGDINKNIYFGPSTLAFVDQTFSPTPVDVRQINLQSNIEHMYEKLSENMHELWAVNKIENGWTYGDRRSESRKLHPCLVPYDRLPAPEKSYNLALAKDTLKTIAALNYRISLDRAPNRLKTIRLPQNFLMINGYKPAPLDTREVQLDDKMMELVELLAKNTHNVWAKEKIGRGWTYGANDDPIMKRSSHLVPYEFVDARIKEANRAMASEVIKTLIIYGYTLEPPTVEHDSKLTKQSEALKLNTRTYRAEKSYTMTSGKWYYEFEVLTDGYMKVGWMDINAPPDTDLGSDDFSFAFDGYLVKKWHQGLEDYGKSWNVGDIIGCFLDLNDKIICFSLNGEFLLDPSGAEMAFDNVPVGDGYVPAFTLAPGQKAKLNFGQDANSFKYFTTCGLQEGYEPFCVNMYRRLPMWFNKEMGAFENVTDKDKSLEVQRIPASGKNPPCLKVLSKGYGTLEKASLEFVRLSLPVKCHASFSKSRERSDHSINKLFETRKEPAASVAPPPPPPTSALRSRTRMADDEMGGGVGGKTMTSSLSKELNFATTAAATASGHDSGISSSTETQAAAASGAAKHESLVADKRPNRRGTIMKAQSLDTEDPPTPSSLPAEHPALRGSASEANLEEKGGVGTDLTGSAPSTSRRPDSAQVGGTLPSETTSKRSRTPLKMLQCWGNKMRDASSGRNKKLAEEKERIASAAEKTRISTTGPGGIRSMMDGGATSAATVGGTKWTSSDSDRRRTATTTTAQLDQDAGSKESLTLLKSGPGRSGSFKGRKVTSKKVVVSPPPKDSAGSIAPFSGGFEDDQPEPQGVVDRMTEYYYGLRILAGQDPAHVWVGWVTPQFHYHGQHFEATGIRHVRYVEGETRSTEFENVEMRSCYMVNAQDMLQAVTEQDSSTSKMSGLLVGCTVDVASGLLSFTANGKEVDFCATVEPDTLLYPAVFVAPTCKDTVQFELGRVKYTLPLSAILFKSQKKSVQPQCPPRLKVQSCKPYLWSRVPNQVLRVSALKLSDIRGWSVLCDDPVQMMAVYVPERDESYDVMELVEYTDYMYFHEQTLRLYCSLTAQGNQKIAHILCKHVDEQQLMYIVSNHNTAGPLRCGFFELLIAVHMETHAHALESTSHEFIIPLNKHLHNKKVFTEQPEDGFPAMTGSSYCLKPFISSMDVKDKISKESEANLKPPKINFIRLRETVMECLNDATYRAVMNCRDLIGGDTYTHFKPILKLFDKLLVIGLLTDEDIQQFVILLDPASFDENGKKSLTKKGLMNVRLAEGVKLELCRILNHLCDIELRQRVETLVGFSEGFVGEAQRDQLRRYIDIKQSDIGPAEAAKKTKEFRCPPKDQMVRLLNFKNKEDAVLDEEGEVEECPMSEHLQETLRNFHDAMIAKIGCKSEQAIGDTGELVSSDDASWVDKLASVLVRVPAISQSSNDRGTPDGSKLYREMIINNVAKWARESFIEDTELIREIFNLLLRQYNGAAEVMNGLQKTYVIHERNVRDIEHFLVYLSSVRGLLSVQFETVEEEILKNCLWHLQNNKVFFQHPDLMRILNVHKNVMTVMVNILGRSHATEIAVQADVANSGEYVAHLQQNAASEAIKDSSEMVVACCKFLCYFCRTSSQNQKAMFEHLPFLLDNATMLLARPSLRGTVPLDVAYYSFMDNNELALALKEDELEKVAFYLSRCGLQPNSEMITKGYPDVGWDPVEGERYVDFLRFCVWVNGESVEENANLVIRLLIRRPECLGPALKGEGQGLFRAFKEAISMSEEINSMQHGAADRHGGVYMGEALRYPSKEDEGEDYIDLGASILDFYSSLVALLGKCAPDAATINAGKGESLRARAILRSLISLEDLEAILSLKFNIPNVFYRNEEEEKPRGLLPNHKQSILLFLERVYGVDTPEMIFRLLEKSFLSDLRTVTMLDHPNASESDIALALNRYLCNSVLPLMTQQSHFFADAEQHLALLDATLHTVYRLSKLKSLTNNQRSSVSDFLVALTREMNPPQMLKLLRKVVIDIPSLNEYASVPLRLMTLHYDRCGKYYGPGNIQGVASEEEKRLTMLLFTSIFDSLGMRAYDPDLFGRALPCLTAIGSSLSPDYSLSSSTDEERILSHGSESGLWVPTPVDVYDINLSNDMQAMARKFAEHFHDSWASRKFAKGWTIAELYSRTNQTHPRLKPFSSLRDYEKNFYCDRCSECIKATMAWGYRLELVDHEAAHRNATGGGGSAGGGMYQSSSAGGGYAPRPVDLSNMTLNKEMSALAEKLAENSHSIWAKKVMDDLATKGTGAMVGMLVPWDMLTDFEKQKNRFSAQEILKFLQYNGYKVYRGDGSRSLILESERASVEKRFAYALLEKLIVYLDNAAMKMKTVKPSASLTRRHSFKQSSKDVKFFSKVVLPLLQAYFMSHRRYFLASGVVSQTGVASNREKEMVASLFCRMALLMRRQLHAFGCDAKPTVQCLQVLVRAIDAKTLVKINSDIIRTSLLMFFNNAAEDLIAAVKEVRQEGSYSSIRGANLKSWVSLEYANQVLVPVLTAMFDHLARNSFGQDLLIDEIQVACYKIADSFYSLTSLSTSVVNRRSIKDEFERHRPALGQCLRAFAGVFPVAFLEPEFNVNNRYSVLAKFHDQSVQAQEMLHSLSANIPRLDKFLNEIDQLVLSSAKYSEYPNIFDVDLPLICSYLNYWWEYGSDGNAPERQVTSVNSECVNRVFVAVVKLLGEHVGVKEAQWLCRVAAFTQCIIGLVTRDPVKEYVLPVTEKLRNRAELAFKEEERLRTHPEEVDEAAVVEMNAKQVRDTYAFFPLLIKYTDLHRAQWLKNPSWETDIIYENVAIIFRLWSNSQHFKREELNFMAQFEDESGAGAMKTGKAAIAERKKKRREGKVKNKEGSSVVVQCLKRVLPVGLNVFGGRELDIVQHSKEKFLQKESEEKIRDFIRSTLGILEVADPTDANVWQRNLYNKIGKSHMRDIENLTQDVVVDKIASMGLVLSILHTVEHPQASLANAWKKIVSTSRKRAVVACFRMVALYGIPVHRAINLFFPAYQETWLTEENVGQDLLIEGLTKEVESEAVVPRSFREGSPTAEEDQKQPDPITQLIQCFQRAATSEQKQARSITDDQLYMDFAEVMSKSIHISEDDDEGGNGDEEKPSQEEQEIQKQNLLGEQSRLAERGAAIMVLMYLSACNGEPSETVAKTLELGIHILNGGNVDVQAMMLNYLQEKKDTQFFNSMSGLMTKCSVLKVEMFERQIKAEGLGMGAELAAGQHQNLNDADFICSLFRFVQLTCEGHNLDFQNYLRTQPGNTTSVNLIICTVDYLLRLQESVMDFYWLYSSKDTVDEPGKQQFLRAISVCSQVFNTLTESIQGPCLGNQMALANSRLWDAINGFIFLFAHMMSKLSRNASQLELLREFLGLQKDMIVLMLSMLEGNVLNGSIGKQMVDTLVESQQNVELILKYFDMFLKLKDLTTSTAFQEFDTNRDGWISPKEFQRAMESQKMYSIEEINYLMMCTDVNNDGKVDYMEFTERFHNPAKDIGFNLAVLLTNLQEHIVGDNRLQKILHTARNMLEYFDKYLGRIEIMGSSKRVEKVYFEIKEEWLEQWNKPQIKGSKKEFLFNVMQDGGGDQGKLEAFINFCEDTIFEMSHATIISSEDKDSRIERAKLQRDIFMGQSDKSEMGLSAFDLISICFRYLCKGVRFTYNALKPSHMNKVKNRLAKSLATMTASQILLLFLYLGFTGAKTTGKLVYSFVSIFCWFLFYLMGGRKEDEQDVAALPVPEAAPLREETPKPFFMYGAPEFQQESAGPQLEAFGIQITTEDTTTTDPVAGGVKKVVNLKAAEQPAAGGTSSSDSMDEAETMTAAEASGRESAGIAPTVHGGGSQLQQPTTIDTSFLAPPPAVSPPMPSQLSPKPTSFMDAGSMISGPAGIAMSPAESVGGHDVYEPKIAEAVAKSKSHFSGIFARSYFLLKYITLMLAFVINCILLAYRVNIVKPGGDGDGIGNGNGGEEDSAAAVAAKINGGGENDTAAAGGANEEEEFSEEIIITESFYYLNHVLTVTAFVHCLVSLALLIAYYQLKVPLIVFKKEKEVARKLLFEGMWITEQPVEDPIRGKWNSIVITSPSFPEKYWDKFVKRKVKDKFKDQFDETELNRLLGFDRSSTPSTGVFASLHNYDWRYPIWKVGVICMDSSFQYQVMYFVLSVLGNWFPFCYACHLIDMVISFPMLQTILKSVTHNGKQLTLTVMMVLVVVYLYTVLAFNFFRNFYVQDEEGEIDRKCHDMVTCFMFNLYAGVRAGGGIGDELESPWGNDREKWRILFDMSFHFFVIIILLAIMQGLIIDAFGELRDQQDTAQEKLESNCFICEMSKDFFDKLPRGFENHTDKEHNLANYLFFLMHLLNKDETEYTGQETYVFRLYMDRCWDFFPVGECFLKQYEDQLMVS